MSTSKTFQLFIGCYYVVLSMVAPIVLSTPFPWTNFKDTSRPTCDSQECKEMSEDLLRSMKKSVDPCKDLYEHVCGNWKQHTDLEPYFGYVDLETIFQYNAYKLLKSKLREDGKPHEDPDIVKAKKLYHRCMLLPYMERVDETVLRERMATYGIWSFPEKKTPESWLNIHNYYLSISGESAFFKFDLMMPEDDSIPVTTLQRSKSPYGTLEHVYEWDGEQRKTYFKFLEKVIRAVAGSEGSKFSTETLESDIRDVFNFRLSLQKKSISQLDPSNFMNLEISELAKWYHGKGCPEKGLGNINWLDVFRAFHQSDQEMIITDKTIVQVHSKDYLHGLCSILTHTRQRTIVNHLHLYFMERFIILKPELKRLLFHTITQGLVSSGKIRYVPEQWYYCIKQHNMQDVLGSLYTSSHLTKLMVKEVHYIIDYIKEILVMQIETVKWLTEPTQKKIIDKINTMKFILGYPPGRESGLSKETITKMTEVSAKPYAYYDRKENVIFISAVYFQPPIYDKNLPFTITYAGLGTLIAHEIYHMFDDQAISTGSLHNIWGRKAGKHYKQNSECFAKHYANKPIKELEYKIYKKARVNGYLTRDENIADVMGLKTSYNAYKKIIWMKKGECPTLKEFKSVPCDRLFFIAYARTFCSAVPEETFVRRLNIAHHSPSRLRVNVPVSSMPEFAHAFNCDLDTPMNPLEKCDIWG